MKPGLWEDVVERDARFLWSWLGAISRFETWRWRTRLVCVVRFLEPTNRWPCGGKQTVDHVKDQPMMGKRAPDALPNLVAMCEYHNVWHPPSKTLRQRERWYLAMRYGEPDEAASAREALQEAGCLDQQEGEAARP